MSESIIYLQNRDIWLEMMQLNIITGETKIIVRSDEYEIGGYFGKVNNENVLFYRKDDGLFIKVNNQEIALYDENIKLSFERIGENIRFIIYQGNEVLYQVIYPSCIYDPINMIDPDFNSYREEDQDFFLFVYNVMQDKEWQNRIYEQNDDF